MKIVLIGYGRMGHEIEQVAKERGHSIVLCIDKENQQELKPGIEADVAIEFTSPATAADNIIKVIDLGIPVVSGSTGWLARFDEIAAYCKSHDGSLLYSSNFSIGVNVLFHLNAELARIMGRFADYKVFIEEKHHIHKLDAPSGTAVRLAEDIIRVHDGYDVWKADTKFTHVPDKQIPVQYVREGTITVIHSVLWESELDSLYLKHEAKGLRGFAIGSILAAEFLAGKKGLFSMRDVLAF